VVFATAITLHGVESSDALRAEVQERVQGLDDLVGDILACRVLIEATSRRLHVDCHYGVYVRITLPCIEIEAGGKPMSDRRHEDPYLTVAETFDVLRYRIEDFARRRCSSCTRYTKTTIAE
jgi:ribosome-associated translation inhibitor RaiA